MTNPATNFLPPRPRALLSAPHTWRGASWCLAAMFVLLLWQLALPRLGGSFLPGPTTVLERVWDGWDSDRILSLAAGRPLGLASLVAKTTVRFVRFLACGVSVGIGILLLAALSVRLRFALLELTWFLNPVPPLLAIPLLHAGGFRTAMVEWVGGSFYPALAVISIGLGAIDAVPGSLEFIARHARAGRLWRLRNLYWPVMESYVLPAFKVHGSYTLGILLVLEWLLSDGLGRGMKLAIAANDGALLLACIVLAVTVAVAYEALLQGIVAVRLRWLRMGT